MSLPSTDQPFVLGTVCTDIGPVPRVSATLAWADHWGTFKARWGVKRMDYIIDPGLYALGKPGKLDPVLVTANYKMSFDRLRESLAGRNAWILVLDTDGVNVWCAAGKGTFSTEELVGRIGFCQLDRVVDHREVILPQLSGPGVAAYQVKKLSGFKAVYGPVHAVDLPAFLDAGMKASPEMRRKGFSIWERMVLVPLELVGALKWTLIMLPAFFLLGGLGGDAGFWAGTFHYGLFAVVSLLGALVSGAVLTPILLPWLPGRAFSIKGLTMGLITAIIIGAFLTEIFTNWKDWPEIVAWCLLIPSISAFLAMNFTGASTYTSLSGVRKEMKWAVPLEIGGIAAGLCLWVGSILVF